MDDALAQAYAAALNQTAAEHRDALRKDQRAWIAYRNKACALSDIDNTANRLAAGRCLGALMANRTELLNAAARTGFVPKAAAADAPHTYRRGADDRLELAFKPDGAVDLAIMAGNARGVCDVEMTGARATGANQGQDSYLFTDMDVGCRVTVDVKGDAATVNASGTCSSYCGVHAPGFVGTYRQAKSPPKKD